MRKPSVFGSRGRLLTAQDTARTPTVVVVDETLARTYFAGGTAVGSHLHLMGPTGSSGSWTMCVMPVSTQILSRRYIAAKQMGNDVRRAGRRDNLDRGARGRRSARARSGLAASRARHRSRSPARP